MDAPHAFEFVANDRLTDSYGSKLGSLADGVTASVRCLSTRFWPAKLHIHHMLFLRELLIYYEDAFLLLMAEVPRLHFAFTAEREPFDPVDRRWRSETCVYLFTLKAPARCSTTPLQTSDIPYQPKEDKNSTSPAFRFAFVCLFSPFSGFGAFPRPFGYP